MSVPRRAGITGLVLLCSAAAAVPALAEPAVQGSPQSTTVSMFAAGLGSRQLDVLDLAGNPLTDLGLRPGAPAPFRVRVTDTGVGQLDQPRAGFTVQATLNNLYLDGKADAGYIPSADVDLSFPAGGALSSFGSVTALPRALLSGSLAACTAPADVAGPLGLDLQQPQDLLRATDVCSALSTGASLVDLPVALAEQTLANLEDVPFGLAGQTGGPFTDADYLNGIGAGDARGTGAGTPLSLLTGVPSTVSLQDELDALQTTLRGLPVVSATGAGALVSVSDVVGALLASADAGLAGLGKALGELTPTQVGGLLGGVTATVADLGLGDLVAATGTYNGVPVLTATPGTTPAVSGTYAGTMTVTLVQP